MLFCNTVSCVAGLRVRERGREGVEEEGGGGRRLLVLKKRASFGEEERGWGEDGGREWWKTTRIGWRVAAYETRRKRGVVVVSDLRVESGRRTVCDVRSLTLKGDRSGRRRRRKQKTREKYTQARCLVLLLLLCFFSLKGRERGGEKGEEEKQQREQGMGERERQKGRMEGKKTSAQEQNNHKAVLLGVSCLAPPPPFPLFHTPLTPSFFLSGRCNRGKTGS